MLKANIAGSWRTTSDLQVKQAGTWRRVKSGFVKVAGQWKRFYGELAVMLGLKNWWPFHVDANDNIGTANGAISGGAFFTNVDGKGCVRLPGNGIVSIPSFGTLGTTAWTFSTWYKPVTLTGYTHLLTSSVGQGNFTLKLSQGSGYAAGSPYVHTAATGSKVASQAVTAGVWSMLTFTYDGTTLKIYINTTLVGTFTVAFNIGATDWLVGRIPNGEEWSDGYQSDLLYYNRALSLAEITALYQDN